MKDLTIFCSFVCTVFLLGCTSREQQANTTTASTGTLALYDQLPDGPAGDLVRKAIAQAGGWETWTSKQALRYVRTVINYDSTGNATDTIKELHQYNLFPSFRARISWESKGQKHLILCNSRQAWKLVDGKVKNDLKSRNSAWNLSFGSHYLIAIPFKLTDKGANLTFEGDTTLEGRRVLGVKVTYDEGAGTSALFHTWRFYFDAATHEYVASLLRHDKGYGYNRYYNYTEVEGIRFYQDRRRTNTDDYILENLTLSSDYKLTDFEFLARFPEDHFTPPTKGK